MKHLVASIATALAVTFATTGAAQAGDRGCRSSSHQSYSHGHNHGYSRGYSYRQHYSSGYCQPQTYYVRPSCPPVYHQTYRSVPQYYSGSCNHYSSGFSVVTPGFGFFFRR